MRPIHSDSAQAGKSPSTAYQIACRIRDIALPVGTVLFCLATIGALAFSVIAAGAH